MTEPRSAKARANGIEIAYLRWPARAGATHPPVVLLHGALQTGEGMRHLAELLALDGDVLVPDLRGRGASERPAGTYDPGTMAEDVAGLLDHLAIGRSVLIGRHHGALIAYHLAARRPERVCGLVIGDATPEVSQERAERVQAGIAALPRQFASLQEAERFYEESLGLPPDRARHDLPSDLERADDGGYRWRHDLGIVGQIAAASMPRSDWGILEQVQCPTLILRGQRGEIRPETAAKMVETMRRARAQTILGAGRDVFLGPGSEQTHAAIQLFLRGLAEGED